MLRAHLTALFKASRCSSPSELELVGIYDRVPGGADRIGRHGRRDARDPARARAAAARPATLIVGRVKAHRQLVTVEISA